MSACGYEQTLGRSRREVCFPLVSGRECRQIREPRVLGLVTAQKRTSGASAETLSLNVADLRFHHALQCHSLYIATEFIHSLVLPCLSADALFLGQRCA